MEVEHPFEGDCIGQEHGSRRMLVKTQCMWLNN
uniref:Uncharacterized protein n=1 Tax=Arundo donax TaxID=35708 RepID=A0A0A9GRF2_ARUDO